MINLIFNKLTYIKEEYSILKFLTGHNYIIACCAIPLVLLGKVCLEFFLSNILTLDTTEYCKLYICREGKPTNVRDIYEYMNTFKIEVIIALSALSTIVIVFTSIFYVHRSLLKNYQPKDFILNGGA